MNYRDHITHWKGTPLKEMTNKELRHALQDVYRMYEEARATIYQSKNRTMDYFSS